MKLPLIARVRLASCIGLTLCLTAASGIPALRTSAATARSQEGQPRRADARQMQQVANLSELRATTADDRVLASYFDYHKEQRRLLGGELFAVYSVPAACAPPPPDIEIAQVPQSDILGAIVCARDAIVVGQVITSRTLLTRSETFLFTEYRVAVTEWIRPVRGPDTVDVAMIGGAVEVGGKPTRTLEDRPLMDLHSPALLFLKGVPGTSSAYSARQIRMHDGKVDLNDFFALQPDPCVKPMMEDLRDKPSLASVLARLRQKQLSCGGSGLN
jgi:hypothetical protein